MIKLAPEALTLIISRYVYVHTNHTYSTASLNNSIMIADVSPAMVHSRLITYQ